MVKGLVGDDTNRTLEFAQVCEEGRRKVLSSFCGGVLVKHQNDGAIAFHSQQIPIHLEVLHCFGNGIVAFGAALLDHFNINFSDVKPDKTLGRGEFGKNTREDYSNSLVGLVNQS